MNEQSSVLYHTSRRDGFHRTDLKIDILWTGGWDSTFRVLELVFEHRVTVVPWYVHDPERASSARELEVMEVLQRIIRAESSEAAILLGPLQIVDLASVRPNPVLQPIYSRLRLGSQYDWLARFAVQHGIDRMELCIERRPGKIQELLAPYLKRNDSAVPTWTLDLEALDDEGRDELGLFSNFSFPLIDISKREMRDKARTKGWMHILQDTWFCHSPRNEHPCGVCTPCMVAIEEGFGFRIPLLRRPRPLYRIWRDRLVERFSRSMTR